VRQREVDCLVRAILDRRIITLQLRDIDGSLEPFRRTGEPYAIYQSSTGKILLDWYQLAGWSESKPGRPGWRQLDLERIAIVRVGAKLSFAPRSDYKPDSPRYAQAIVRLVL
jgi:hypothetical protein